MASTSNDTTAPPPSTHSRRRRWTSITIAAVGIVSASALFAVPAIGADGNPPDHDRVIVCESGVETNGDIQMSSATATRLPNGDTTPVPEGCREG